jgi:3-dehydroquinate dehydratase I
MNPCIVISEKNMDKVLSLINTYFLCEIRLDLCQFNEEEIKKIFSQNRNLIATFSDNNLGLYIRIESLKIAIASGATYVDIDYNLDSIYTNELVFMAKEFNTKVIISYHDFIETPDDDELKKIIYTSKFRGADLVKIATFSNSQNDSSRLLNLYKYYSDIIAFGIGEEAKYTRVESMKLGAPFTYVYLGKEINKIATGQLSLVEYNQLKL